MLSWIVIANSSPCAAGAESVRRRARSARSSGRPSRSTVPASGSSRPLTTSSRVAMPASVAPTSATVSPARTSRLTSSSAGSPPRRATDTELSPTSGAVGRVRRRRGGAGLLGLVEQLDDAARRARGARAEVGEVAELGRHPGEDAAVAVEGHELAERDLPVDHGAAADGEHEREADVGQCARAAARRSRRACPTWTQPRNSACDGAVELPRAARPGGRAT